MVNFSPKYKSSSLYIFGLPNLFRDLLFSFLSWMIFFLSFFEDLLIYLVGLHVLRVFLVLYYLLNIK